MQLRPIGLSIMVVLSEWYLQRLEENSIALSFAVNISPKTFKRYVDNSHVRFENKQKSLQFLEILNKQDTSIQYTIEFQNNQKQLNFLGIIITNTRTYFYDVKIFRKPAIKYNSWHPVSPFQFLNDSDLELIQSAQNAAIQMKKFNF